MTLDILLAGNDLLKLNLSLKNISESEYDLKKITIIIAHDKSLDVLSREELSCIIEQYRVLFFNIESVYIDKDYTSEEIIKNGLQVSNSSYFCFLNNSLITKETLSCIVNYMNCNIKCILGELRSYSSKLTSIFHPLTLDIDWFQGGPCIIRNDLLLNILSRKAIMNFDFVSLNLKIRNSKYTMKYIPSISINRLSDRLVLEEEINHNIGRLYLSIFQGNIIDLLREFKRILRMYCHLQNLKPYTLRKIKHFFLHLAICYIRRLMYYKGNRYKHPILQFDKMLQREGDFTPPRIYDQPRVSVIVRTHNRPDVLRETLISLRNQSYRNIEIIIYEDGKNTAEWLIEKEFVDLNIRYFSSIDKVGRCVIGNRALAIATGKYINFLDDDDIFLPNHIEDLVSSLESCNSYKIAYSLALETPIRIYSLHPYKYRIVSYNLIYQHSFNRLRLFYENYIPIQSVMFYRDVFLRNGGFDEKLDVLEDWDLWIRYSCENDFLFVDKITSIYRVPPEIKKHLVRDKQFEITIPKVRQNENHYYSCVQASDCAKNIQEIIQLYQTKNNLRSLIIKCLKIIAKKILSV